MKRLAIIAVLAAACGSSPPPEVTPPPPPATTGSAVTSTTVLGLGEITIKAGDKDVLAVHANGQVQIFDGGSWKPIGTLSTDGRMVTSDGKTGQLQADGTFMTPEGPVPFKLDGAALVAGKTRLTIENGKLLGGNDDAKALSITGAETDATKRTALLLLGLLQAGQQEAPATGSAVSAPPTK